MGDGLKILALADLHDRSEQLSGLDGVEADLVVVCGDLHNGGPVEVARSTVDALSHLGHPVLIVPGNTDPRPMAETLWSEAGFINLDRRAYCHRHCRTSFNLSQSHNQHQNQIQTQTITQSIGFIGFGGMVPNNPKRIGDPNRYYHSDEEVYQVLAERHEEIAGCDWRIVVTHQPPRGDLGRIYNGEISGCASLVKFLNDCKPDLLICGHIHEARGMADMGRTKVVNVGEMGRGYSAMAELNECLQVTLNET
ncbi:MAG TPA: metallophosphoesterase [Methanotrichaceae archaeon]|nr:metallophosphoesterase [Methanotrichaceae archaeon]